MAAILVATVALLGLGVFFIVRGDDDSDDAGTAATNGGGVAVEDAWTTPDGGLAVVYLTIHNGAGPDRLVGATAEAAGMISLMADDVDMAAETVADAASSVDLEIPPGATELHPGGSHLMLTDLDQPLQAGGKVAMRLTFENAGPVDVEVEVLDREEVGDRSG